MSSAVADGSRTTEAQTKDITVAPEWNIALGLFVFFARLFAIAALVAAAGAMGSAEEALPFFTHDFQFHASFEDFPALVLLVVSDIVVVVYLCLSIIFSIVTIARPTMVNLRVFLLVLDLAAVALTTAAGSAAAAVVHLARAGNATTNWAAICRSFRVFCAQTSGAVVASFAGTALLVLSVLLSALSLGRQ